MANERKCNFRARKKPADARSSDKGDKARYGRGAAVASLTTTKGIEQAPNDGRSVR